jgi:hypothetical protein
MIHFEDQQLTSFLGLLIFQLLFKRINLKNRLKKYFSHLKTSPIFGRHLIVLLIIVHLLIGFRRLRKVDYYRDDPIERLTQLKEMVENRKRWRKIDSQWSYFETSWKPKSWDSCYRFIFTRKKTRRQRKGISCPPILFNLAIDNPSYILY